LSVSSKRNIFLSVVMFFSKCDLPEPIETNYQSINVPVYVLI
jgi:hypothetical protein